jgi:TetR/AcrR family transcriptional repressor of nem operon
MMTVIILIVNQGNEDFLGHSQADKTSSHDRIVQAAAARFRESGIDGVGVADLMKDAGLTHGGFYRHFASRDELVGEAVERALHDGGQAAAAIERALHGGGEQTPEAKAHRKQLLLAKLVEGYLDEAHRDALATSCAVTTLAGDVARSTDRTRSAYTRQVGTYLELLMQLIATDKKRARRTKAIAALSTLVGALSMARAVNDENLSREILTSAADELKAVLSAT